MRLPFVDREKESLRLRQALSRPGTLLLVMYGRKIPGFESARCPDWTAVLQAWRDRSTGEAVLAIDEFP